jgi:hypothetical protein
MDKTQTPPMATIDAGLDRVLAGEEELVPSSGFLAAVMEQVREEAAAPPPIPFPWKRALPGFVVVAGVLGWGGYELARAATQALRATSITTPQISGGLSVPLQQTAWVALALASWVFSRRVVGR